jgi:hypothetical protein
MDGSCGERSRNNLVKGHPVPSVEVVLPPHVLSPDTRWERFLTRRQRANFVLHQAATHFFHSQHSRFLGRGRQKAARAVLQLPGALRCHDNEAISAGFGIARYHALCGLLKTELSHFQGSPRLGGIPGSIYSPDRLFRIERWRLSNHPQVGSTSCCGFFKTDCPWSIDHIRSASDPKLGRRWRPKTHPHKKDCNAKRRRRAIWCRLSRPWGLKTSK